MSSYSRFLVKKKKIKRFFLYSILLLEWKLKYCTYVGRRTDLGTILTNPKFSPTKEYFYLCSYKNPR